MIYGREDDHTIETYMRDIGRFPLLTWEQEQELSALSLAGDLKARNKLIAHNLRFVVTVAAQFKDYVGVPFEERIADGYTGLVRGAERYDATRGYRFISYAVWWIRQGIQRGIAEKSRTIVIPVSRLTKLNKARQSKIDLQTRGVRQPDATMIADDLEITDKEAADLLAQMQTTLSLDHTYGENDDLTLADMLAQDADEPFEVESDAAAVRSALDCLTARQREVIVKMYWEDMTLEEVGVSLGVTRERIRQIRLDAFERLAHRHGPRLSEMVGGKLPVPRKGVKMEWFGMRTRVA